jgi:hypothetical protein
MRVTRAAVVAAGLWVGLTGAVEAQPSTDIFLASVRWEDGMPRIGTPVNATQRDGYDNQPWFLPDGSGFLYASERGGQTDIYRYELSNATSVQITDTPQNEYSPSLDGERMLVVRWPVDMSTGALWWYSLDGQPLELATGSVPRVGYYAVLDERTLALFVNDSVQSFVLSDRLGSGVTRVGQEMNGSAPRRIPGTRAVSFQQRMEDGVWWLMRLDSDTRQASPLGPMIDNVANYTWTDDGAVLAATGNTIHLWRAGQGEWREVARFDDPALQGITRIAISPAGDRIAFVSARP